MYFWVTTTFAKMDWNPKWDRFGSKATEITKKPHLMDRKISGDGGLFDFSSVSSTKSSIPASPNSVKGGMETPNFELNSFRSFSGNLVRQMEIQGAEVSAAAEPLIGLKLGKRMYFEDKVSVVPMPSTTLLKKTKSVSQNIPTPNCVVQGCNADLSMAKDYHRKHRVCDRHSKCARVIVGGLERRFCQQCSRFHSLSEFDEKKRSCRKRLSDHNARRRKPQRETIKFTSARLASPFNGERQQLNYLLDNSPLVYSGDSAEFPLDTPQNPIFTITEGNYSKPGRDGGISNPEDMSGIKLPTVTSMHSNEQFLASMSSVPQVLIPGSKGPPFSFQFDAAPQYCSALSLLSNDDTLDSSGQENTSLHYLVHEKSNCVVSAPMRIPTGVPLSSPDFLPLGHQSDNPRPHSFVSDTNFQETQLLYEAELFSNMMD